MNEQTFLDLSSLPINSIIDKSILTANVKIEMHNKILCSISGGSDSDIILHLIFNTDKDKKVTYVFFDTGIEYEATKRHLDKLEIDYGVKIHRIPAKKSVVYSCKKYGVPFISKQISENINRLQNHNFSWEDKSFEEFYCLYPKCKSALRWWCNCFGEKSSLNINKTKWLKEFLIINPPTKDKIKISQICCHWAKKKPAKDFIKKNNIKLNITGMRKSEGGVRATSFKTCFSQKADYDDYRPIWYYNDKTKIEYEKTYGITHSDCYTKYGLKRTGCFGCPCGSRYEEELEIIKKHEPKLYKAAINVFSKSYEYAREFKAFKEEMKEKEREQKSKQQKNQTSLFDEVIEIDEYEAFFGGEEDK